MTPEDERLAWEALSRLESGEEVSLLVGNGPRPMEVKLSLEAKAFIAAIVAASLRAELDPPPHPEAAAWAMAVPETQDCASAAVGGRAPQFVPGSHVEPAGRSARPGTTGGAE